MIEQIKRGEVERVLKAYDAEFKAAKKRSEDDKPFWARGPES